MAQITDSNDGQPVTDGAYTKVQLLKDEGGGLLLEEGAYHNGRKLNSI